MSLKPRIVGLAAALVPLFISLFALPARTQAPEIHIVIQGIRVGPPVDIDLKFLGSDHFFVPSCGTTDNGEGLLCTAATQLQVHTHDGWKPAMLRRSFGVLGGVPLSQAEAHEVGVGAETSFVYRFSRRFYEVAPGQELRVQVQVWRDKKGITSGVGGSAITSPPFKCPDIKITE